MNQIVRCRLLDDVTDAAVARHNRAMMADALTHRSLAVSMFQLAIATYHRGSQLHCLRVGEMDDRLVRQIDPPGHSH